jgi:hypothetical protein
MSNKRHAQLDRADRALREASHVGMEQGIKQIILRHAGFELANSRPYHNYENWSDEYEVLGRADGKAMPRDEAVALLTTGWRKGCPYLSVTAEDLDDACARFAEHLITARFPESPEHS